MNPDLYNFQTCLPFLASTHSSQSSTAKSDHNPTHHKSVFPGMLVSAIGPIVHVVFATSANTAVVSTVGASVLFPHCQRLVDPCPQLHQGPSGVGSNSGDSPAHVVYNVNNIACSSSFSPC